jgi:hypothetical protein
VIILLNASVAGVADTYCKRKHEKLQHFQETQWQSTPLDDDDEPYILDSELLEKR